MYYSKEGTVRNGGISLICNHPRSHDRPQVYMQTGLPHSLHSTMQPAETNRQLWPVWGGALRRWGLSHLAATIVESAGPLNVLLAQVLYFSQPLVQPAVSGKGLAALAQLLDDPQQAAQFAAFLREEERQ